MNPPSGPRQQQQKQKKTLRIQKRENTLEFHSRLIEAAEGCFLLQTTIFPQPLELGQ
jgi:hypothetical protein